jgi:hypothetical protein
MIESYPTERDLVVIAEGCIEPLRDLLENPLNDDKGREISTTFFMSSLLQLYLLTKKNPALKETAFYQDFLQSSAPLIVRAADYIVRFDIKIEDLFHIDPMYDPWSEVCWRHSAFEAFKEIYQFTQETELKEYLDFSHEDFDSEDIDYMIEGYALRDGSSSQSTIPEGIPRSHWWWWGKKATDGVS